jgi:hypothetical protein
VTAVGISCRICVVLEEVDIPRDAFFAETLLRIDQQTFQDSLAGLVMYDGLDDVVTFRSCVFGMTADV